MRLKRCCCVFVMKKTPLRETELLVGRLQFVVIGKPLRTWAHSAGWCGGLEIARARWPPERAMGEPVC